MGLSFVQLFFNTFILEFCSLAFHLHLLMWLFCSWWECLFLSGCKVPLQSACVTLIVLFTLWHIESHLPSAQELKLPLIPCSRVLASCQWYSLMFLEKSCPLRCQNVMPRYCSFPHPKIIFFFLFVGWLVDLGFFFCNRGTWHQKEIASLHQNRRQLSPVKSSSLALKSPIPKILEAVSGIISTSFFSHISEEFKLTGLLFEALPESRSVWNCSSSADCSYL